MFVSPSCLTFILISVIYGCHGNEVNFEEHNRTMRIPLYRQKTPREQQLNAPFLNRYGIHLDWVKPKPGPNPPRTNDSIALWRYLDHEFYGTVVIGHPGQTLNVAFDTAWSYSWVLSSKCSSIKTIGCYFHKKYDNNKSSEYKPDGTPFNVNEGSYNLTGFFSYDNISIAHSNVTNQSFIEMTNVPREFIFNKADGVLGLGLKVGDYNPFFYTLLNQNKIRDRIFSIFLSRDPQSNRGGNILLGFVDEKHIHKSVIDKKVVPDTIKYLPVDTISYWQFTMDRLVVNHNVNNFFILCPNTCKVIVDTSSNTIIGPQADIDKIHEALDAKELFFNRYSVKCDTINKLPKLDFVLGGQNFSLPGSAYITKLTYFSFTICLSAFEPASTPDEQNRWVLGASFLVEYYSIYDLDNKRIGFVKAA